MNIAPVHLDALKALGYTEAEARFLYLVATHSGYFVARQFLAFANAHWGERTTSQYDFAEGDSNCRGREEGSEPSDRFFLFPRREAKLSASA